MAVICGSRAHLQEKVAAKRNPIRNLLMHGFHFAVWLLCVRGVKDTQCGFKLFSRRAARLLFMNQHVERWAFDVDLLYLARHLSVEICEVPVNWQEIDGRNQFKANLLFLASIMRALHFYRVKNSPDTVVASNG